MRYRVVDLRSDVIDPNELFIENVRSPEEAARTALGVPVVRSGAKKDLIARVYWHPVGTAVNMVRLYRKIGDDPGNS